MKKKDRFFRMIRIIAGLLLILAMGTSGYADLSKMPQVLSIRERAVVINNITDMRLERLLPGIMRETGFDMWIILCNEDDYDPVFNSMKPYDTWCPIVQILVLYDRGPDKGVERLNVSRSDMRGLFEDAWDHRAWDNEKKESQWDALARIVKERDPQKIAINQAENIWAADSLSVTLKDKLVRTIGPKYSARLSSAEKTATLWFETLLDEELELYEGVVSLARRILAETLSNRMITPGVTTLDDLKYSHLQLISDLGIKTFAWPWFRIRWRDPEILEKYGMDDLTIRHGDLIQLDAGISYLRYYTDHSEWGYVLRPGETDIPEGFKQVMSEGNRLQDIFCGEFKEGLTGNEILANILRTARERGVPEPKIYSHALGYFLHEPGPLIGLPWEQKDTGGRGEVRLVPNSTFTAELSVNAPVPGYDGKKLRLALEQMVAFTQKGTYYMAGRQKKFYLIK
ncbi:MAG: aminopeptidase P family protein [Candidatus Aminicenantes bacterium]|nr:aminopeptidase P family protein [Candidatus Aminicenantes bacterium]